MKKIFLKLFSIVLGIFIIFFFLDRFFLKDNPTEEKKDVIIVKKQEKLELDLLFVGDIMFDRKIRKIILESENSQNFVVYFLNNFPDKNKKYDYVIGNLEGPITENKTKTYNFDGSYTGLLTFTFPTSTPEILNLLNVKVVSLANNHTNNFGYAGFKDTLKFLEKENINYFGNPYNSQEDKLSETVCEKNICIGYIGYNEFTQENDSLRIENEIKKLKEDHKIDFVVVFAHWGEEYRNSSNKIQKLYAKSWIDVGADLVVGAHPHVIEESEVYKDKYIYYSLGNYIFDQWFSEDVKNGLAVNFKFKKEISENGEIKKEIELVKEIKIRSEKTEIKYILD